MNAGKNKQIKEKGKATRLRHKSMSCKVYTCKIDKSHLSNKSYEFLRMVFIEAKWFVNDILASDSILCSDYKKKNPTVLKDGEIPEERKIVFLSAQIRQSLVERLKQSIYSLAKMKKKGMKVGRLKFKKNVSCLPLNQVGVTFKLVDKSYIHLQGCKGNLKVSGLSQIPSDAEIARADLVNRAGNYFVKITCYLPKVQRIKTGKSVGLDFGITTSVTTSDGQKFNISIPEPTRLRKLQRGRFCRKVKHSKNWIKVGSKISSEYEKVNNQKKDLKDKLVSQLVKQYDIIACQNENIKGWKEGRFGRQVQASCMGGIISDLKHKAETFLQVSRWYPSTKTCHKCGNKQEVLLSERIFTCQNCGATEDRDIHSAINILNEGLRTFRLMGSPEDVKSPVELTSSTDVAFWNNGKLLTMNQEAIAL
jgi:putative transposase